MIAKYVIAPITIITKANYYPITGTAFVSGTAA